MRKTNKVKEFIKKNGKLIGTSIAVGTAVGITYTITKKNMYGKGFADGHFVGFGDTIRWFDNNLSELRLGEAWKTYMEEYPEKIVLREIKRV